MLEEYVVFVSSNPCRETHQLALRLDEWLAPDSLRHEQHVGSFQRDLSMTESEPHLILDEGKRLICF